MHRVSTLAIVSIHIQYSLLFQRFGAADDVHQFFRNGRLAGLVVIQGHFLDQLAGVARRAVHRRHPRAMFRRGRFQQNAKRLRLEMFRHQDVQEFRFIRLIEITAAGQCLPPAPPRTRSAASMGNNFSTITRC